MVSGDSTVMCEVNRKLHVIKIHFLIRLVTSSHNIVLCEMMGRGRGFQVISTHLCKSSMLLSYSRCVSISNTLLGVNIQILCFEVLISSKGFKDSILSSESGIRLTCWRFPDDTFPSALLKRNSLSSAL